MLAFKYSDGVVTEEGVRVPAPPGYFVECVRGLEEGSALAFLGMAVIDSTQHEVRPHKVCLAEDARGIGTLLYRETHLLFGVPGHACVVKASYREEVRNLHEDDDGSDTKREASAVWEIWVLAGMAPGLTWIENDSPNWLNLSPTFKGEDGKLVPCISHPRDSDQASNQSSPILRPGSHDVFASDVEYQLRLSETACDDPNITPEIFVHALRSLGDILQKFAREGQLGPNSCRKVSGFPPWTHFTYTEDAYWEQVDMNMLAPYFECPPVRDRNDSKDHDRNAST